MAARANQPPPTGPHDTELSRFVERLGSALTQAGMARLPARVFARLLGDEDGRMTAAELAEALEVSPASISGAVRYLAHVNLLHRERERGSRRDVYVIAEDAWHDAMINSAQVYDPIRLALAGGIEAVGGPRSAAGGRLAISVEFLEFLVAEMQGVSRRWEQRRTRGAGGRARRPG